METPPSIPEAFNPDVPRARAVLDKVIAGGRTWLTAPEANEVLAAYAIPVIPTHTAHNPIDAARLAGEIDGPVALKVLSPDITHKSDVGGVKLDLADSAAVHDAAQAMLDRVREIKRGRALRVSACNQ